MSHRAMALVCLRETLAMDRRAWLRFLGAAEAGVPEVAGERLRLVSGDARQGQPSAVLAVGTVRVAVAALDAPVPMGEFAADAAQQATWPGWRATVAAHRAHLVVAAFQGGGDPRSARAVGRVAARLASLPGACAVLWSASRIAHEPAGFRGLLAGGAAELPPELTGAGRPTIWRAGAGQSAA